MSKISVYYDGDCPLCRAEIAHYARRDTEAALNLIDVADPGSVLPEGTDRATALGRFHVTNTDGELLSGAAAFVAVWRRLPGWRMLGHLARIPGMVLMMEGAYRLFLPLRPAIVRAFVWASAKQGRT